MARTNSEGEWINSRGKATPPEYVDPIKKHRDRYVERIVTNARKLEDQMKKKKSQFMRWIDEHLAYVDRQTKVERNGKGNVTLTNYSGDLQVEFSLSDIIEFDERLQNAKALIDQCLKKWTKDAAPEIRAVIDEAFEVDKKGKVNTAKILRLRSIKIKDTDWQKALDMIADSIEVSGTRQYLVIRERDASGKWQTINLNFSSI
jgi:hypothetical protein